MKNLWPIALWQAAMWIAVSAAIIIAINNTGKTSVLWFLLIPAFASISSIKSDSIENN